jgi:hypothetical protein
MEENILITTIKELTNELRTLNQKVLLPDKQPLYTNQTMKDLLKINTSTLKKYRDEGFLGFSKIGDIFYYTSDDITKFLSKTHNEPFAFL